MIQIGMTRMDIKVITDEVLLKMWDVLVRHGEQHKDKFAYVKDELTRRCMYDS